MNYNVLITKIERGINQYRKNNGVSPASVVISNDYLCILSRYYDFAYRPLYIQNIKILASEQVEDDCMVLIDI